MTVVYSTSSPATHSSFELLNMHRKRARDDSIVADLRVWMTMNSSPVMALPWYSVAIMEICEAMDFGGGLGEVELV